MRTRSLLLGERDELVHLVSLHRRRLLDEDVLPGRERASREVEVRGHGRRDDHGVELVVAQHLVEVRGEPGLRIAGGDVVPARVRVAEPAELGDLGEVAREVRSPVAETGDADAQAHSFQTLSERRPFEPVAFRRSTTSTASSTSWS